MKTADVILIGMGLWVIWELRRRQAPALPVIRV